MKNRQTAAGHPGIPTILEFADLTRITKFQRAVTLALPFVCAAFYFFFAVSGWWISAVLSLMFLSFITYGSTSHDLVHGNLGLRRSTNNFFLFAIELLALRSGHAYRLAHLHHHARYPATGRHRRRGGENVSAEGFVGRYYLQSETLLLVVEKSQTR